MTNFDPLFPAFEDFAPNTSEINFSRAQAIAAINKPTGKPMTDLEGARTSHRIRSDQSQSSVESEG